MAYKYFIILFVFLNSNLFVNGNDICDYKPPGTILPHPDNCYAYYACINGVPVIFACASGTHFDPITLTCQNGTCPDTDIDCPLNDDPQNPTFIPSARRCAEYFICINGLPVKQKCREGLYFNAALNLCDFADCVECPSAPVQRCTVPI